MSDRYEILIVDDEAANLQKLKRTLLDQYLVREAASGEEGLRLLRQRPAAVIVTDQRMPGMTGVEFLRRSLELCPNAVRIILTGYTDVEYLMDAINHGHVDRYITKPWEPAALKEVVRTELATWELKREQERLAGELEEVNAQLAAENVKLRQEMELIREPEGTLVYRGRAMQELLRLLQRVVTTDSTVLIQGETGTGKELVARHIHRTSNRKDASFVPVNCGAVPSELVESSFFGHRRGSFTGATADRKGYFELANHGTLFLDEIGDAPAELQVKLLRVLEGDELYPVGAERPLKIDVRVIASTNRNLATLVQDGKFRQDLFFRLNVFSIHVPPLRARREDIPVLSEFFLERFRRRLNRLVKGFDPEVIEYFENYDWPGNVRELENEIERLVLLCDAGRAIEPSMVAERIRYRILERSVPAGLKERLAELEKQLILEALRAHGNNKTRAAESLGITRQTVIAKLKEYAIR